MARKRSEAAELRELAALERETARAARRNAARAAFPVGQWSEVERENPCRPAQERVTLRLEAETLRWFRGQGQGYQARISAVLRAYMLMRRNDLLDPEDEDEDEAPEPEALVEALTALRARMRE